MSDDKNESRNLHGDNDGSKPTCIVHLKEISLYCTECQDVLCTTCLVEKHQTHPVKEICNALDIVKEKVGYWCTEQSTTSHIKETKDKLQNLMENTKQAKVTFESDLRKTENDLKTTIEEEANQLSDKLKEVFQKHESRLQRKLDNITECEKSMDNFDVSSTSNANILQLYSRVKSCISKEFNTDIDTLQHPSFCVNTNINVSIGIVKPNPDDERMSQVAKIDNEKEQLTAENKVYPIRIATFVNDNFYRQVSKIVPIGDEEALVISNRGLYCLHKLEFKALSGFYADDVVRLENGSLLILQQHSTVIDKIDLKWKVSIFTRTDPYRPMMMTYFVKSNSLMVLLNDNTIVLFGLDGIKKQVVNVPLQVNGSCLDAVSCSEFAVVDICNQQTLPTHRLLSFTGEALKCQHFYGIFGSNPGHTFSCKGICYDDEGYLIVSDFNYNAVYRLDKKLKLQKILIDKHEGVDQPTAVAVKDGLLWVANSKSIAVYKYSEFA